MLDSWRNDIPKLTKGVAIILLLFNIFIPPIGTFLCACLGSELKPLQIGIGFLQLLLIPFIIGYVWSIWWGIEILSRSDDIETKVVVISN